MSCQTHNSKTQTHPSSNSFISCTYERCEAKSFRFGIYKIASRNSFRFGIYKIASRNSFRFGTYEVSPQISQVLSSSSVADNHPDLAQTVPLSCQTHRSKTQMKRSSNSFIFRTYKNRRANSFRFGTYKIISRNSFRFGTYEDSPKFRESFSSSRLSGFRRDVRIHWMIWARAMVSTAIVFFAGSRVPVTTTLIPANFAGDFWSLSS